MSDIRAGAIAHRRFAVVVVAALFCTCIVPIVGGATDVEPRGYLVFWDTVPVGPDLDAGFHVVVPDDASVLWASLDAWGSRGTVPVAPLTEEGGLHAHTLGANGTHGHVLASSDAHNHTVEASGAHTHDSTVEDEVFSLQASKMSVTLPTHTHFPTGASVASYDFPTQTSQPHNHVSEEHGHGAYVLVSGTHSHVTSEEPTHVHTVGDAGGHEHEASTAGAHLHDLKPGRTLDVAGTRPSSVSVAFTGKSGTSNLGYPLGISDEDWHVRADVSGLIDAGTTRVGMSSATAGTLEYLLVVALDEPYGVLAGRGPIGPSTTLEVPMVTPQSTLSASMYLFGSPGGTAASETMVAGGHQHVVDLVGDHNHTVGLDGSHDHVVSGGEHGHDVTVEPTTVLVDERTPTWDLGFHAHSLTWLGGMIQTVGTHPYGTVSSVDHTHTTLAHGHTITFDVSGDHSHALSDAGIHSHSVDQEAAHTHGVDAASAHDHGLIFSPAAYAGAGPTGVRVSLDDVDITDSHGGPWSLGGTPVGFELDPSPLAGEHTLNVTSTSEGEVEWLVMVRLGSPGLLVSTRSLGDAAAHIPLPPKVVSGTAWVRATPYVLPFGRSTSVVAGHQHVTSTAGDHTHSIDAKGAHAHTLEVADHTHGISLDGTTVAVQDATADVDLPSHDHSVGGGFPVLTAPTRIQAQAGTHAHDADAHNHTVNWTSTGEHDHPMPSAGGHDHELGHPGAHTHTMLGGSHPHQLERGTYWEEAYPTSSDVTMSLGGTEVAAGLHPTTEARWWERVELAGATLASDDAAQLDVASATFGTLTTIVFLSIDLDAPSLSLVSAPQWVRGGEEYQVVASVAPDIDAASLLLAIEGSVVEATHHDAGTDTVTFDCRCLDDAVDGLYYMRLSGMDLVGNEAESVLGTLGVDSTAPTAHLTVGGPKAEEGGVTWVRPTTPILVTATDLLSGPGEVEYVLGPVTPTSTRLPYDISQPAILEDLADGDVDVTFLVSDVAGNVAPQVGPVRLRVDGTAPGVSMDLAPSVENVTAQVTLVGTRTVASLEADDGGGGSGVDRIEYAVDDGTGPLAWRTYDIPFVVPQTGAGVPPGYTLRYRAVDRVGNGADDEGGFVAVVLDATAPVVARGVLPLPTHTNGNRLHITYEVDRDIARLHIRVGDGVPSTVDVEGGWYNTAIEFEEGPNDVLVSVEDAVGNVSPWTYVGTVIRDMDAPRLLSSVPASDTKDVSPGTVSVTLELSEVCNVQVEATVDGDAVEVRLMGDGTDASRHVVIIEDVPGGATVEMRVTMTDLAHNAAEDSFGFETTDEGLRFSDFLWGLVVGLVMGLCIAFLVLSRAWRGRSAMPTPEEPGIIDRKLPRGSDIISPDGTGTGHTAPEVDELEPVGAVAGHGDGQGAEGSPEDERGDQAPVGPEAEEDDTPGMEGEGGGADAGRTGGDDGPPRRPPPADRGDEQVEKEISDEIDRLLGQSGEDEIVESEPGEAAEDTATVDDELPDPDSETVDPGAR